MRRSLETDRPGPGCQIWRAPECPFPVEWSAAVMEEIRVAAMEALFSLPHGGAEIGGVLWGTRVGGRVRILAARPLECEHALGPTFTLSGNDQAHLARLLEDGDLRAQAWEPVGWYHSHTRSEIFLSGPDLEIHNRYFPHPWQVALVVRPHAMQPMRAGFFFREANGSIHAAGSYGEFLLQSAPQAVGEQPPPKATVEQPPPQAVMEPAASLAMALGPAPPAPRSHRWLLWIAILLGMAAGLFVFGSGMFEKDWTHVFAAGQPPSFSLMAYDLNGQLQIHWDWAAEAIRTAESGTLEIADGAARTVVALDKRRLLSGTVSYARTSDRVDVRLALRQHGGRVSEEFTSYLGQPRGSQPDAFAARLLQELQDQAVRTSRLERAVTDLRWVVRRDQETRRQDGAR